MRSREALKVAVEKIKLNGCKLTHLEIEDLIMRSAPLTMPDARTITPGEFNWLCDFLTKARTQIEVTLSYVPDKL